ncbi:MAG: ribosome biogenesis GTP-binding protein YihA/YsxC [Gammaproteobacteria bacterium]|nr:ribosome biogenesis GTP-binding protein YihA/YsxC [Gammaproteobacteria bacterium]MBU1553885.1 ribosome biogenesis GTP-binding protein YihA/YsxC [Gammaproteobacteria bacterium]MBU2069467.1 ribosome biogenesis GTP-binding protein YihA/YsxC [Gammaproteobacteria bacterium]MBU2182971.1 ribosome biogenesis GTP-binding protein YihA/YsxC [Gammaproteobacteria bacterium]MBU2203249.1 ribosome biogenesis GTP-binding protein YihA/YsxC [Gammaproteobacteria bacterium]
MYKSKINYQSTTFLTSAPDIRALPADEGIEVAFAGRSNAGKSSALNTLTRQNSLARTSKTPGRTQLINTFSLDNARRLIDLPGYGFAKVPLTVKEKWQKSLAEYLMKRSSLKGLVVLMDIRHPLKDLDQDLIHWAVESKLSVLILLTKADKLGPGARKKIVLDVREASLAFMGDIQVQAFSSLSKLGLPELEQTLDQWFGATELTADSQL